MTCARELLDLDSNRGGRFCLVLGPLTPPCSTPECPVVLSPPSWAQCHGPVGAMVEVSWCLQVLQWQAHQHVAYLDGGCDWDLTSLLGKSPFARGHVVHAGNGTGLQIDGHEYAVGIFHVVAKRAAESESKT